MKLYTESTEIQSRTTSVVLINIQNWGAYLNRIGLVEAEVIFQKFADHVTMVFARRMIFSSFLAGAVILQGDEDTSEIWGRLLRGAFGANLKLGSRWIAISYDLHILSTKDITRELSYLADRAAGSMQSAFRDEEGDVTFFSELDGASRFVTAMNGGRILLRWPAVRAVSAEEVVLYGLAEPSIASENRLLPIDGRLMWAMRQMKMERLFSQRIALAVLDRVKIDPSIVLGIPLPASSAVENGAWQHIFAEIAEDKEAALRIIFEIKVSNTDFSIEKLQEFSVTVKALGCGLVLADFGDQVSIGQILALNPDLVRIGVATERIAMAADADLSGRLADITDTLLGRPASIIDGVRDMDGARDAGRSGARWMAGPHCGYWPSDVVSLCQPPESTAT